jgi:hypothetical protein
MRITLSVSPVQLVQTQSAAVIKGIDDIDTSELEMDDQ